MLTNDNFESKHLDLKVDRTGQRTGMKLEPALRRQHLETV